MKKTKEQQTSEQVMKRVKSWLKEVHTLRVSVSKALNKEGLTPKVQRDLKKLISAWQGFNKKEITKQ